MKKCNDVFTFKKSNYLVELYIYYVFRCLLEVEEGEKMLRWQTHAEIRKMKQINKKSKSN